ncbi:MAG TPA: hypothetical protein VFE07_14485 [Marmoricola sp.]|nr:hypothetical protein [Marmoricola sp.]
MGERARTSHASSHRGRVVATATAAILVGATVAGCHGIGHGGRAVHPPTQPATQPATQPTARPATARRVAQEFVSALRAGDRGTALRLATATVYDELVRDEAGATGRVRLEHCVRSSRTWSCGLDFPSTGPADGESYSLTLTSSGTRWTATATAPLAG